MLSKLTLLLTATMFVAGCHLSAASHSGELAKSLGRVTINPSTGGKAPIPLGSGSLEFFNKYPDSSFVPPLITHSISISGRGMGHLLLNAHSIVVFASTGKVTKQFRFRAPRDRDNVFIRLVATYLLDTRSGEIYKASSL